MHERDGFLRITRRHLITNRAEKCSAVQCSVYLVDGCVKLCVAWGVKTASIYGLTQLVGLGSAGRRDAEADLRPQGHTLLQELS